MDDSTQIADSIMPTSSPRPIAARAWGKRLVFLGTAAAILLGIFGATTHNPVLMRRPEQIASAFDATVLEAASKIDHEFRANWEQQGLRPAPEAPWHTIARRISLGMVGNGLSLEEYRSLEKIPEDQRLGWWTEYLLKDRRWSDHFAERFARATVGTSEGPFLIFRRRKYVDWLADRFEENMPYDQIASRILSARGSWTDSPEVNFLTATMDENNDNKPDAVRLAGRTSRAFLAMRIDCLQCHNDYLGNVQFPTESGAQSSDPEGSLRTGQQSDFHQLAAYFGSLKMDNPFSGLKEEQGQVYRTKYLNSQEETEVVASVPFETEWFGGQHSNRQGLAAWVTRPGNRAFARATVNRVWAILTGKPLVQPIDDIPAQGPYPPGLEALADDFIEHGYDLKRLVRVIIATGVYQIDSQWSQGDSSQTEQIDETYEKAWAVFPITQLRPEQMAAAVHQACRLKTIDASSSILSQLELYGGVNDFTKAYGSRGEDEFVEQSVTIPQRLLMMNGQFLSERIDNNPIMNAATRIAGLARDDQTAVSTAFLSTLNRPATAQELEVFTQRLEGKRREARSRELGNLFWVLLNSSEFQWNH
ncbi:MAG: DUF1549 and DUF1553 domain-containing protein [Pirellula sp.]|jgi:hypothetical protein|nr:DUF1549 and DUF1553 domain-containing protein [Pirellula sp.]